MSGEVITIYQLTGAGPTYNEATAIRFCSADTFNPGLNTPCKVPPVGITAYYSYWITLILHYSGDFSLINNARFWGPGNIAATWFPGSKGRMVAGRMDTGDQGFLVASYQQASGTAGLTGYALKATAPNGHAQYNTQTISVVDVDDLDEESPLTFDSRDIIAEGYSKAFCLQTECYPGAAHGEATPVTLIIAVDVV
jgi:hypothetical protein